MYAYQTNHLKNHKSQFVSSQTGEQVWSFEAREKELKFHQKTNNTKQTKEKKIKQKEGLLLVLLQGRIIKIDFNNVNIGIYWILCNDSATRNNVLKTIFLNVGHLKQIIWYYLSPVTNIESFSRDSGLCHDETVYFRNQTKLKMTLLFSSETTTYTCIRSPNLALTYSLISKRHGWEADNEVDKPTSHFCLTQLTLVQGLLKWPSFSFLFYRLYGAQLLLFWKFDWWHLQLW